MAEFALGLTKTAVAGTVSRVKSAIEEEAKLRVRVQDDLVFITGEFEMMQSFLSASNAGERASKNQVVRTWVRQLRDLAFDVEDCVEFIVHLDKPSRWDWVQRLASSVLVCMARPPLLLDVAVADIKRLKARVEDVSQRNTRYNLIGGDDSPPAAAGAAAGRQLITSNSELAAVAFEVLKEVWKARGKLGDHQGDLKNLINRHCDELQVVSLWRRGADADVVGDDANHVITMKKAYDDPDICHRFEDRAWVNLSPHRPFNPVEFITNLLTQFRSYRRLVEENNGCCNHTNCTTISELLLQLRQRRYLIVIEQELTTISEWDTIRMYLPDGSNGSRVVVCTNNLGIAMVCTGDTYQVSELKRFSHDRALYAFYPKGSGHGVGMENFIRQFKRPGVISVLWESDAVYSQLMDSLYNSGSKNWRVLDGMDFEYSCWYRMNPGEPNQLFLANIATAVLLSSSYYPEDEDKEETLARMSPEDKIERCRESLSRHNWLVCIENLRSALDWDLIKQELLSESTRGCVLVITDVQRVATECADHDTYRALNARDLMKGSHQQGDRGGSIKEEDKFELGKLVGRDDERFVDVLTDETISVWGIAGVGKSAFVREKYYNYKINSKEYNMYGWVDVPHPFDLKELCWRLLLDLYSDDFEAKEAAAIAMMEGQDLSQWCSRIIHQGKFLLVLDGLQSKHDWDLIKSTLFSQPISGNTVVITREESIAIHCAESRYNSLNIKGLGDDAAFDLLNKIAFGGGERTPYKEEVINPAISRCGGFPGVLTAVGILGAFYLEHPHCSLMGAVEEMPCLRSLFCWMESYFDACSDELKPCIFYLSVFPPDQRISLRRLLRRWVAEGYSSGGGAAADAEKGEKLLLELTKLSIVYEVWETSTVRYKVNGFFREYIKSRPMEDNLVFVLEGSCGSSSRLTGQHLTISSSWDRDEVVFNDLDLSRLRSFTMSGEWRPFLISDEMKLLRVLDLEGTSTSDVTTSVTDEELDRIVKLLSRIKFLSLRGCVHITRLPDSLGDMRQLETLDAKDTSIIELPPAIITKLHKLQYIWVGTRTDTNLLLLQAKTSKSTPTPPSTPPSSPPQTPSQEEDRHGGTSPFLAAAAAAAGAVREASAKITGRCTSRAPAGDLVESFSNRRSRWWPSKKQMDLCRRRRVSSNGGGVEVGHVVEERMIGRLTHLHTLGIVNVAGGKGASLFLKELKKLTQLRKLKLCGINRKNWSQVCEAISGNLPLLEYLSLQLVLLEKEDGSYDFASFDKMHKPPKTLKRLKVLYTTTEGRGAFGARIGPAWLTKLRNMGWSDEVTISSQEDAEEFNMNGHRVNHFRIKPFGNEDFIFENNAQSSSSCFDGLIGPLRIECSGSLSTSTVTFTRRNSFDLHAVSIHCCCSSSAGSSSSCNLKIYGLDGLRCLCEVTVTGTYADGIKRDLSEQVKNHQNQPVLK